jgi:hypothetical protein
MFFERNKVMLGAIYAVILTGNLIVPLIFNVIQHSRQFSYLAGLTFFSLVTFACLRALGMLMRSHRKVDAGR